MAGCLRSHCLAWSGCANVLRDKWTLGCDRATFGFLQCSTQEGWLWGQRRLDGGRRGGGPPRAGAVAVGTLDGPSVEQGSEEAPVWVLKPRMWPWTASTCSQAAQRARIVFLVSLPQPDCGTARNRCVPGMDVQCKVPKL